MSNTDESISLIKIFKEAINEWFSTSTTHAPNTVKVRNGKVLKIIWICCFIASTIYCSIVLNRLLYEYYSFTSSTSTKYISESPALFPAVAICNIKMIDQKHNPLFVKHYLAQIDLFLNNPDILSSYFTSDTYMFIGYMIRKARFHLNTDFPDFETRKSIGYQLEDMLISCFFNNDICNVSDFTYYYDTKRGNCYKFNSNSTKAKTVSSAIPTSGLILELFLGNVDNETFYGFNDGVVVSVHNQSHAPFTTGVELMAPANAETNFIVNRNFIRRLPSPHGNCEDVYSKRFRSILVDYILNDLGYNYSQTYCFSLCQQAYVTLTCGCSDLRGPVFKNNSNYCSPENLEIAGCLRDVIKNFNSSQAAKCNEMCPFECDTAEYTISSNQALYPNKYYSEQVLTKFAEYFRPDIIVNPQSFAKINVYYESMNYAVTTDSIAISFDSLFSNFGGTLGLYLGISFLSFIEIIEFGFNIIDPIIKYFKTKKQINFVNS